jgi:hypothetical protein
MSSPKGVRLKKFYSISNYTLKYDSVSEINKHYYGLWTQIVLSVQSFSVKMECKLPYILESNPHPNLIRTQFLAIS